MAVYDTRLNLQGVGGKLYGPEAFIKGEDTGVGALSNSMINALKQQKDQELFNMQKQQYQRGIEEQKAQDAWGKVIATGPQARGGWLTDAAASRQPKIDAMTMTPEESAQYTAVQGDPTKLSPTIQNKIKLQEQLGGLADNPTMRESYVELLQRGMGDGPITKDMLSALMTAKGTEATAEQSKRDLAIKGLTDLSTEEAKLKLDLAKFTSKEGNEDYKSTKTPKAEDWLTSQKKFESAVSPFSIGFDANKVAEVYKIAKANNYPLIAVENALSKGIDPGVFNTLDKTEVAGFLADEVAKQGSKNNSAGPEYKNAVANRLAEIAAQRANYAGTDTGMTYDDRMNAKGLELFDKAFKGSRPTMPGSNNVAPKGAETSKEIPAAIKKLLTPEQIEKVVKADKEIMRDEIKYSGPVVTDKKAGDRPVGKGTTEPKVNEFNSVANYEKAKEEWNRNNTLLGKFTSPERIDALRQFFNYK
jgi:hypothetical protein